MRQLLPFPLPHRSVQDAYGMPRPMGPGGRPWVGICMVTSVDGSTVVGGRSGGLSDPTDQEVLATLRATADAVLVGAGTVRAEGYGAPRRAGLRIGVVTRSGSLELDTPLFRSGVGFVVTSEDGRADDIAARAGAAGVAIVRCGHGDVDLAVAITRLPGAPRHVHVEGGPTLNGALVAAGVVDEIDVTTSPRLVGGTGARLAVSDVETDLPLEMAHLMEHEGFLYARWVRPTV